MTGTQVDGAHRQVVAAELGALVETVQRQLVAANNLSPTVALGLAISQVVRASAWYPQWAADVGAISHGGDEEAERLAMAAVIRHVPIPRKESEGEEA